MKSFLLLLLLWCNPASGILVSDWGAGGADVVDDTAALQAAFASAQDGDVVEFKPGRYLVSVGPFIELVGKKGIRVEGNGARIDCGVHARGLTIKDSQNISVTGLTFLGTIDTTGYVGNEDQGRIVVERSSDVEIHGNRWESTAAAVFIQVDTKGFRFHHNWVIGSHAGVQTSSAYFSDLVISDNTFVGHVSSPSQGSDDMIAVFGSASGRVLIEGNRIDKQGPTAQNHARAINVSVGAGSSADIVVIGNSITGVATTTPSQARPAIVVEGVNASRRLSRVTVKGNTILNSNQPIRVGPFADAVEVAENTIDSPIVLAGYSDSGKCVLVSPAGNPSIISVRDNHLSGCTDGISLSVGRNFRVSGNTVVGSTAVGVRADTVTDSVIVGNRVTGSVGAGILVANGQRVLVSQNTVLDGQSWGIQWQGAVASGVTSQNITGLNSAGGIRSIATQSIVTMSDNVQ